MDEAAWKALGEWVEQRRERAGLTVGELADRAQVSRIWLQVLRKGGRRIKGEWQAPNPKNDALARVARALSVSVDEMFARAGRGASPHDEVDASAAERIHELEQRVTHTEQEMAELRRLLEEQRTRQAKAR